MASLNQYPPALPPPASTAAALPVSAVDGRADGPDRHRRPVSGSKLRLAWLPSGTGLDTGGRCC